ncbi:hypothetical protein [Pyrobaculum sp.]|uniref:hypothetical protein n=1 Tax=Pyrobaculum sp. TaxID=2004705 RepID=UPI003171D5B4
MSALAYNVFWGEFVHCDVGSCPYPNPEGKFLEVGPNYAVFDTRGDPSAMGFFVLAVEFKRHTTVTIQGWWSYELPRTLAYVVSDKGLTAFECSTGGGQQCSVSGAAAPGVYYIVFVDAWAAQTVRVEADGPLDLIDVSPQRVACALWRAGVLRGQRITYAFNWPSRPGASVSQDIVEGSCGPPDLQEALAFAAAAGLNATEASLLTRPLGYNVTAVERKYGSAVFYLQPDLTYVVPLALEVQWPNAGRLLLVNPSNVSVTWAVELRLSNKTGSSGVAHGSRLSLTNVTLPPRSVYELYLYGVAREGGSYVFSYRIRAAGSYSWSNYVFYTEGRLVTQNGSFLNWLWGRLEQFWGGVTGDKCAEARGAGRSWAAERLGLQGVVAELDAAAGFVLMTTGVGELAKAAGGAAKASEKALEIWRKLSRPIKAVLYLDLLANGVLLGWDAYQEAASGQIPWREIADAALMAGGPVLQRSRLMASLLASGSGVMLFLGEPFDAAQQFADDLYAEASKYGNYSHCFIDGALQAFSTYAQEATIANYLGVVSTFVDWSKLELSRHWLGYRQIAALSAFDYKTPGPIFKFDKSGYRFIAVNKEKLGYASSGNVIMFEISSKDNRLYSVARWNKFLRWVSWLAVEEGKYGGVDYELRLARFEYQESSGATKTALAAVVVDKKTGVPLLLSYNDYFMSLVVGKALQGGVMGRVYEVTLAGVKGQARAFTFDFPGNMEKVACVNAAGCRWETLIKYLTGVLAPELYNARPEAVGMEVFLIKEAREVVSAKSLAIDWLEPGSKGLFLVQQPGTAFDVLAIDREGRLVIVEVKRKEYLKREEDLRQLADKISYLRQLDRIKGVSVGDALSYLIAAYNGAGPSGIGSHGASSTFVYEPVLQVLNWKGDKTRVIFSFVVVDIDNHKAVVYTVERRLEELTYDFIKNVAKDAYDLFDYVKTEGGVDIRDVVRATVAQYSGTPPFLK